MLISEFIERTGFEPSSEEYHFIEESYYESNLGKDDFCKCWAKANEMGFWDKELDLRSRMEDKEAEYKKANKALDDSLNWYMERLRVVENEVTDLKSAKEKCEDLEAEIAEMTGELEANEKMYEDLQKNYKDLQTEYDKYVDKYAVCKTKADALELENIKLKAKLYDMIVGKEEN